MQEQELMSNPKKTMGKEIPTNRKLIFNPEKVDRTPIGKIVTVLEDNGQLVAVCRRFGDDEYFIQTFKKYGIKNNKRSTLMKKIFVTIMCLSGLSMLWIALSVLVPAFLEHFLIQPLILQVFFISLIIFAMSSIIVFICAQYEAYCDD